MAYVKLKDKDGKIVHTTRDCPAIEGPFGFGRPSVTTILYAGKVFVDTDTYEGDFRLFVEGHSTWDAGGPLSGTGE